MTTPSKEKRTSQSKWTVDSGVLLLDGKPQIELNTVTQAHCTFLSRNSSYSIVLVSPGKTTSVSFGAYGKKFGQTGSEILRALQRAAPHIRVHMRGGPFAVAINFLVGVVLVGLATWYIVAKLVGEVEYGWEALPFVLFFAALGGVFIWLYHPWNSPRFYTTPRNAAKSIRQRGWRAFYHRYG